VSGLVRVPRPTFSTVVKPKVDTRSRALSEVVTQDPAPLRTGEEGSGMITDFTWANAKCQSDGTSILKLTRENGQIVEFHCARSAIAGLHELTGAVRAW